jgi:NAD(P)-dependent dehydrogenase (short-subunit alcohol dehydrogenase family)
MKTIIITGGSDGIGGAAAEELTKLGHRVIIVGRSPEKTKAVADQLGLTYYLADYTKLSDVVSLANELRKIDHIDVLANNAGGIMGERAITGDGFEKTFQVNYLAGFLLTHLLLDKLIADKTAVINTSSIAANMFGAQFDINDLNNANNYDSQKAYGNGKLADILFTRELHRRFHEVGLTSVAFHPGVVRTSFANDTNSWMRFLYHTPLKYLATISPAASAHRLTALAAGTPDQDWQSGAVYDKNKFLPVKFQDPQGNVAKTLWETSEKLLADYLD